MKEQRPARSARIVPTTTARDHKNNLKRALRENQEIFIETSSFPAKRIPQRILYAISKDDTIMKWKKSLILWRSATLPPMPLYVSMTPVFIATSIKKTAKFAWISRRKFPTNLLRLSVEWEIARTRPLPPQGLAYTRSSFQILEMIKTVASVSRRFKKKKSRRSTSPSRKEKKQTIITYCGTKMNAPF